MRIISLKVAAIAIALLAMLAMAPIASASSCPTGDTCFDLTANNLGITGSVGFVTLANTGTNQVTVTIAMNSGFSVKLEGGDIAFNGPSGLTAGSVSGLTADANSGLSFMGFKTNQNISAFGTFAFDYTNAKGAPHGVVSANTVTFVLTSSGLLASQFTGVAIHFCTASGSNCGPMTGFATTGPSVPPTVPEPGTLGLLGTGLVGIAGLLRRRLS